MTQTTRAVSEFVKRQTPQSEFSHFDGTWDELLELVEANWEYSKAGYRDGVILVPVPPDRFFSGICELKEGDRLGGQFKARQPGEAPRKSTYKVGGQKSPAKYVEIVLYRHDVLAENNEHSCDATWEVISINASPINRPMPISPGALIANHLQLSGGTATKMTDSEFVVKLGDSVGAWGNKVLAQPQDPEEEARCALLNRVAKLRETLGALSYEVPEEDTYVLRSPISWLALAAFILGCMSEEQQNQPVCFVEETEAGKDPQVSPLTLVQSSGDFENDGDKIVAGQFFLS